MGPRPYPPTALCELGADSDFIPSAELSEWANAAFLAPDSRIYNPDHAHLGDGEAGILWLWTSVAAKRHGMAILGETQLLQHGQSRWSKALPAVVATRWYRDARGESEGAEETPDFTITLYAPWCAEASDAEFMALVEHELYHCGQQRDEFGELRFSQATGRPLWAIRGHDCEEFAGVVARYGIVSPGVAAIVEAAKKTPAVSRVSIAAACGTCKAA